MEYEPTTKEAIFMIIFCIVPPILLTIFIKIIADIYYNLFK